MMIIETLRSRVETNQRIIDKYKTDLNESLLYALKWYSEQAIVSALWVENGTSAIAAIDSGNINALHDKLRRDVLMMASIASFSSSTVANLVERHRLAVRAAILGIIEDGAQ